LTLILLVGLIAYILINFDAFFLQFHQLFFEGDSFAFRYDDTLIRLYPEQLWNDAAILIGVLTGAMAVGLLVISWWWRRKVKREA
jgi:integral membrane protein (TIGR01906 family)